MGTGIVMILVGFLLIFLEFFLPGGIMGIAGGVILIIGLVLFAYGSPSLVLTIGVIVASCVLLGLMVRWVLKRLRSTKAEASFYLRKDQEGYRASAWASELIGREGEAMSDMKPAGHVRIDGKQYQAVSKMGYLTKGTKVKVVGGEGAHLIVRGKEE